jgi:hypothetical protein
VAADGSFIVAWHGPDGWNDGIFVRRFDAAGAPLDTTEFQANTVTYGPQWDPAVGIAADHSFVVAWSDSWGGRIVARRYAANGTAASGELTLSAPSADSHGATRLAVAADGSFAAGWEASDFTTYDNFVVRTFAADGTPTSGEAIVRTGFWVAAIDLKGGADGSVLATWQTADSSGNGIYARARSATGVWGAPIAVPVVWFGDQLYQSSAALAGGGWVMAWEDEFADGSGFGIFGRRLAADGTPVGPEFPVNATTAGNQTAVSVASAGPGFTAAWLTDSGGSGDSVISRQFSNVGSAAFSTGGVAVAPGGSFETGWTQPNTGGYGVEGRHYDPILFIKTQTTTLKTQVGVEEDVTVKAQVTVFADHALWEYWVTNISFDGFNGADNSAAVGNFQILDYLALGTDMSNNMGWTLQDPNEVGQVVIWTAEDGAPLLYPGQTAYFTLTTAVTGIAEIAAVYAAQANESGDGASPLGADRVPVPALPPVTVSVTDSIPINANNDNWGPGEYPPNDSRNLQSQWATGQPNIPAVRDFDTYDIWQDDPQLMQVVVTWPVGQGNISLSVRSFGTGRISFWTDARKTNVFTNADLQAKSNVGRAAFYVEGDHESYPVNDLAIVVKWVNGDEDYIVPKVEVVTPVVNFLSVIPGSGQYPAAGQNINPKAWTPNPAPNPPTPSWNGGVWAREYSGPGVEARPAAGVVFGGSAIDSGVQMGFVQNLTGERNGRYGTAAGWVYLPGSGYGNRNTTLPNGVSFPLLDSNTANDPLYPSSPGEPRDDIDDPNRKATIYTGQDSPSTGAPTARVETLNGTLNENATNAATALMNAQTKSIDLQVSYRLFFVVSYPSDGSIYSVGYIDWKVSFYAVRDPATGLPVVQDRTGLTSGEFVRLNYNPSTSGPFANDVEKDSDGYSSIWQ